ncbi:hypothetical protein [Streptomyces prunicolor]|uniref:hypothetical protein n=1 Tax=Streptomyces prunicolor TaxID=67348 RepID=UPI0033CDB0AD
MLVVALSGCALEERGAQAGGESDAESKRTTRFVGAGQPEADDDRDDGIDDQGDGVTEP